MRVLARRPLKDGTLHLFGWLRQVCARKQGPICLSNFKYCLAAWVGSMVLQAHADDVTDVPDPRPSPSGPTIQQRTLRLSSQTSVSDTQLSGGFEASQISSRGASVAGIGVRFSYEYAFSEAWSVRPGLSLVTSLSSAQGFDYTGLDAFFRYNLRGTLLSSETKITHESQTISSETLVRSHRLSVGAGLSQLFLNGSHEVFPAAGVGLEIAYSFPTLGHWVEASVRGVEMTSNKKPLTGLFIYFSLLFGH